MRRLLVLIFLATTLHAEEVVTGPTPSWVHPLAADSPAVAPKNEVRYGMYTLLDDHQVRVTNTVADYKRRVEKVLTSGGVQNASELTIDFDPTYETVVLHSVLLMRGGKTINELPKAAIRVIDKEDQTADRIYDGMRSALVILSDVRPGDIIDYSYSLDGGNPILGGKYADEFDLTSTTPAHLIRHRLIWPASRTLRFRNAEPRVETRGNEREYIWERRDVPPMDVEDQLPEWFDPYSHVQVSEFASWGEVGQWSSRMFRLEERSRVAVRALAVRLRTEHPRDTVTAAIRFVQDDIRYLGIEMGRNSHEPHQPADVLTQRWGDCKDKSFLLASLLRELGLEAYPALVNTKLRHELDEQLPSPFLFDHVITQVIVNGKTYWVDGTLGEQGGTLETIETPNDERALIVRAETKALTNIASDAKGSTLIEQTYSARDYASPVSLDVVTTYRGRDADSFRSSLVSDSLTDVARDHLNRYAADHPKIEAAGLPQISDDRQSDVITLRERYRIRELWKNGEWSYSAHAIESHLQLPDRRIRTMPLAFDFPLDLTQRVIVRLPDHLDIEAAHDDVETTAFRFDSDLRSSGNAVTATYHLRALRDGVPATAVADHLMKINDVRDSLGITIDPVHDAPLLTKTRRMLARHVPAAISISILLALLPAFFLWRARRRLQLRDSGNYLQEGGVA
jgi:transglutaminase-like putative cysteine protease